MEASSTTPGEAQAFYEEFSLGVGLRDWLRPNPRHEQLRLHVGDVLAGRSGLTLLDVGCGAGVMTSFLTRFGNVTGTDFSHAAIAAAQRLEPAVDFRAGALDVLPDGARYDVITLFDVLEHIPRSDRPAFLAELRGLLTETGLLFISTPHPAFTAMRRAQGDETLQIIDEEVELRDVIAEIELPLVRYAAFDVFRGSAEYQVMVFQAGLTADGGEPVLVDPRLAPVDELRWRIGNAVRVLRHGRRRVARWFLSGEPPEIDS